MYTLKIRNKVEIHVDEICVSLSFRWIRLGVELVIFGTLLFLIPSRQIYLDWKQR